MAKVSAWILYRRHANQSQIPIRDQKTLLIFCIEISEALIHANNKSRNQGDRPSKKKKCRAYYTWKKAHSSSTNYWYTLWQVRPLANFCYTKKLLHIVRWLVAWSVKNATSICALLMVVITSKISILNSARGYNEIIDTELWKLCLFFFYVPYCSKNSYQMWIVCETVKLFLVNFCFQRKIDLYEYIWYFINLKDFSKVLMPIDTIQHSEYHGFIYNRNWVVTKQNLNLILDIKNC